MKNLKATFILVLLTCTLALSGCSRETKILVTSLVSDSASEKLFSTCDTLLESAKVTQQVQSNTEDLVFLNGELTDTTEQTQIVEMVSAPSQPVYTVQTSVTPFVSCLFHQNFFSLKPRTTKADCIDNPFDLNTIYQYADRNLNLFVYGSIIDQIYALDGNMNRTETLPFTTVNGIIYVNYYMPGAGTYSFEIVTHNTKNVYQSFYVSVKY